MDGAVESRLIRALIEAMASNDAPLEQYERLGLPQPDSVDEASVAAACVTTSARGAQFRAHNGSGTPMGAFAQAAGGLIIPTSMENHLRPGVLFGAKAAAKL